MNICFFMGKIITEIEYKFIVHNKKYYAIAIFQIELNNKSIITLKGYNEIADYCYSNLNKNDIIILKGYLNSKFKVDISKIDKPSN